MKPESVQKLCPSSHRDQLRQTQNKAFEVLRRAWDAEGKKREHPLLRAYRRLVKAEDTLARAQLEYWTLYAKYPEKRRLLTGAPLCRNKQAARKNGH